MFSRISEYKTLFFRIFLAYFFYFIARVFFYLYNSNIIVVDNLEDGHKFKNLADDCYRLLIVFD